MKTRDRFKLASLHENNEFEVKKRKKHKKNKHGDKEKSVKLKFEVDSGSSLPAEEIFNNGNYDVNDYLSKSHKKKKKHKHHKKKKKKMRYDITVHEEMSLGKETLADTRISKRPIGLDNTNRITTNFSEFQNGEWSSDKTSNPNKKRQTLQQLLTYLLRDLEHRDPQQLFAWPVTDIIAPNYSSFISKPMDFETIRRNIQINQYTSLNAFVADFKLMCANAMTYNQPETIFYKAAKRLLHAGLKLTRPKKLKKLLTELPGIANIPPSQLGFDINQDYHGETSNDTIIPKNDRSSGILLDNDILNQLKIISKFEAIPDNMTSNKILKQEQNAEKIASENTAAKNTEIEFVKQQNNESTSLSILVPNDGINLETGERPVLLGSLIGKLNHGVGSILGFREDRRNMVKTVKPLYYGAFGSYAPTYDSTFANLTKDESDLVLRTYTDGSSMEYADSILNCTKDTDYVMTMADNLLDLMTGGDQRKTKCTLGEQKKQVILDDNKKGISQPQQTSLCESFVTSKAHIGSSNISTANNQTKSDLIQIDQLKSLSELGIDTKFIDYYQEQRVFQDRLDQVGGLLGYLQSVQNQRLSAPLPQHLSKIAHPSPQEVQLADKITESLTVNLKRVPPSAVMSVTGVRKALGIAQISHLDASQNSFHLPNMVNRGSSYQQTQVSLKADGVQYQVGSVKGSVSGVKNLVKRIP